jgi:carbamoyltransferase
VKILGISCFYHDSAVAAVEDGKIRFAVHEERLSRVKHDARFPVLAVRKALEFCRWDITDVDEIVFYEKPGRKLLRIFDLMLSGWPETFDIFSTHLPSFYRRKMPFRRILREKLGYRGKVSFCEHHRSHAAAAFYTSPFNEALVLTVDGVGESETTALYRGTGNRLRKLKSIHFPDSLGLFYSVFTDYLGFEVNEGEYKVMGLAPYGEPRYLDRLIPEPGHEDGRREPDGAEQREVDDPDRSRPFCWLQWSIVRNALLQQNHTKGAHCSLYCNCRFY